jgi:nucleoside-diphosphate-sugar epimerase
MKILTTGTSSGLGRHIHESMGGIALSRNTSAEEREALKKSGVDVIVHCAFNSRMAVDSDALYDYIKDNVLLTEEMVSIPHGKFVYVSSVDVYPKVSGIHSEEDIINIDSVDNLYGTVKLMSESIVRSRSDKFLILRSSAMLGKHARKNSLIRMIEEDECVLSLSGNSRMNYILHTDVSDLIRLSIDNDMKGIYNMISSKNIVLSEVADILGKKVQFGSYIYDVGDIDGDRIRSISPAFKKTSKDVIEQFIKEKS